MRELSDGAQRVTRIFSRGNFLTKGDAVEPGLPDIFPVSSPIEGRPMNRLDLARWLVSSDNPLAARVLANRLWAELYGRGIVETLEDFGSSGMPPTHPELLDHLALRLSRDLHWSDQAVSARAGAIGHVRPDRRGRLRKAWQRIR